MNPFHSFSKGNKHLHSVCLPWKCFTPSLLWWYSVRAAGQEGLHRAGRVDNFKTDKIKDTWSFSFIVFRMTSRLCAIHFSYVNHKIELDVFKCHLNINIASKHFVKRDRNSEIYSSLSFFFFFLNLSVHFCHRLDSNQVHISFIVSMEIFNTLLFELKVLFIKVITLLSFFILLYISDLFELANIKQSKCRFCTSAIVFFVTLKHTALVNKFASHICQKHKI